MKIRKETLFQGKGQYTLQFLSDNDRDVAWVFEDVRTIRNFFSNRRRRLQLGGPGGMVPQKILKFRVSEMPSPGCSAGHFQ